jgi:hypothetical protein
VLNTKSKVLTALMAATVLSTAAASAQTFEFMSSIRHIDGGDTLGYVSLTHRMAGAHADGLVFRAEIEGLRSTLFDDRVRQHIGRVSVGYSWSLDGAGTFAVLAGPTYVSRKTGADREIDETGYYLAAEYGGFVADRSFAGAILQYSSPDKAWYGRGFTSYYVTDQFGVGPDLTYLDEPGFSRMTLGVRSSFVFHESVFSAIVGQARSRSSDFGRDNSPFVELQLFRNF